MVLKKQWVAQDTWTLAQELMAYVFAHYERVAVSFSGGKDSTAVLHVALHAAQKHRRLPLEVIFWDEEAIHPETVDYVNRVRQWKEIRLRWLCLPVTHRNACSKEHPYWNPWAPEDKAKWCRYLPPWAVTKLKGFDRQTIPDCNGLLFPKAQGPVALLMGLRAVESMRRYRGVSQRRYLNYLSPDPKAPWVDLVKPIYDWTTEDVWTAPHKFGWDYNRAYDVMEQAGITRHAQRVCPPYGEEPLRGLWQYAQCWPDLWARMVGRVPGAATAGRYARSPLYGYQTESGWTTTVDPTLLIQEALKKWPMPLRAKVRARIQKEILNHYSKTAQPIPPEKAGKTGVTWKYLYNLALRGDLKGRRNPQFAKEEAHAESA